VSVGSGEVREAIVNVGRYLRLIRESPTLRLATSAGDIRSAKAEGQLAVGLHFQGVEALEYDLDLPEVFWRLGVRVIQLAYNRRNPFCDGCEEPRDAGLSILGRKLVAELNRLGVLIDVSHTGWKSSLDAVDVSDAPCIASHSNAHAVHPSPRNLPDELIVAIAQSGGVIGMNGFPSFVAMSDRPTLDEFIDHMVYIDALVGSGHVGLGIDYYDGGRAEYDVLIASGMWNAETYRPPPFHYPAPIERPSGLRALTERLSARGYAESEIKGILGENWLRVYERVWG
jgi:membrane dipeptidase